MSISLNMLPHFILTILSYTNWRNRNSFNRGDRQIPPIIVLTGYTGTIDITKLSGFIRSTQSPTAQLSTTDIITEITIHSTEEIDRFHQLSC